MLQKVDPKPSVFLDNTIQVARVLGDPAKRQHLNQILTNQIEAVTSAYVFMEFQRSVIDDFAHVHARLAQTRDWGETVATISTGRRSFRPRAVQRANRILGETLTRSRLDIDKGILLLATYLDYRLERDFWHNVHPLENVIRCDLVHKGIALDPKRNQYQVANSCRKDLASCHLPTSLAENRSKIQQIQHYLSQHPNCIKQQARVERLLALIVADPRAALGQASCWSLGDIIIVLQVPKDTMLWSLDSDFDALTAALDIPRFHLTGK